MTNATTPIRPELETLPARMQQLPVDDRGFPVPWFVGWIDGKPEFRVADGNKWRDAIERSLCWVCGQRLGAYKAFVIGPMCGVNRTTAEPPCHRECAEWSARNCPFLARPKMVRREDDAINNELLTATAPGIAFDRNPGVACVWVTHTFSIFSDPAGKPLITLGEPVAVVWYCEGKPATRAQVVQSVESGLPLLRDIAERDPRDPWAALQALKRYTERLQPLLPAA